MFEVFLLSLLFLNTNQQLKQANGNAKQTEKITKYLQQHEMVDECKLVKKRKKIIVYNENYFNCTGRVHDTYLTF